MVCIGLYLFVRACLCGFMYMCLHSCVYMYIHVAYKPVHIAIHRHHIQTRSLSICVSVLYADICVCGCFYMYVHSWCVSECACTSEYFCVYVFVSLCVLVYACICVGTYLCIGASWCMYMRVCACMCMYACTHIFACACMCACMYLHVRALVLCPSSENRIILGFDVFHQLIKLLTTALNTAAGIPATNPLHPTQKRSNWEQHQGGHMRNCRSWNLTLNTKVLE